MIAIELCPSLSLTTFSVGWSTSQTVNPREYERELQRQVDGDGRQGFYARNRFRIVVAAAVLIAIAIGLVFLLGSNPAPLIPTLSPPSRAAIASESTACRGDISSLYAVINSNPVQGAFSGALGPLPATKQPAQLDKAVAGACPASVATWVDNKVYLAWLNGGHIYRQYSGGGGGIPPLGGGKL